MFIIRRNDKLHLYDLWLNSGCGTAACVAAGLFYLTALQPLIQQARACTSEVDGIRHLIQKTSSITQSRLRLEAELDKVTDEAAALQQRIPSAPREADFLAQVCQLAEQTGLDVADYRPGAIEDRNSHRELEVRFTMSGEYASICRFFTMVDELPRLCRLTQLEISRPAVGDNLSVEATFRIYFAASSADQATPKG